MHCSSHAISMGMKFLRLFVGMKFPQNGLGMKFPQTIRRTCILFIILRPGGLCVIKAFKSWKGLFVRNDYV